MYPDDSVTLHGLFYSVNSTSGLDTNLSERYIRTMMNDRKRQFTTAEVKRATGVWTDEIKSFVRYNALNVRVEAPQQGRDRLWSLAGACELALLAQLRCAGVPLPDASLMIHGQLELLAKNPLWFIENPLWLIVRNSYAHKYDLKTELDSGRNINEISPEELAAELEETAGGWTGDPETNTPTRARGWITIPVESIIRLVTKALEGKANE